MNIGVPQGSILGPLLFSIFINDITTLKLDGEPVLYADDLNIVLEANDYSTLESKLQNTLNIINEWMYKNQMTINIEKSNYMIIDMSNRYPNNLNVNLGENQLKRNSEIKILGVIFDEKLNFKTHINNICKKVRNRVNLISRLKYLLPKPSLNLIYKTIVQPIIDYGINIYGFTYSSHINKIQSLQNRAAKIITNCDNTSHSFTELKWKTFNERRNYFSSIYIFKCLNRLSSHNSEDFFKFKRSSIRTRSITNNELELPNIRLNVYKNSIFYSGINVYNSLNFNVRNVNVLNTFIRLLRNF